MGSPPNLNENGQTIGAGAFSSTFKGWVYMEGLAGLLQHKRAEFKPVLGPCWPNIIVWTRFSIFVPFYDSRISGDVVEGSQSSSLQIVNKVLALYDVVNQLSDAPLVQLALADGTFELAVKSWLLGTPNYMLDMDTKLHAITLLLTFLQAASNASPDDLHETVSAVFRVADGKVADIASAALDFLKNPTVDATVEHIRSSVKLVGLLLEHGASTRDPLDDTHHRVLCGCLKRNLVPYITRTFVHFSHQQYSTPSSAVTETANSCMAILLTLLEGYLGYAVAPIMLHCGLLEGLGYMLLTKKSRRVLVGTVGKDRTVAKFVVLLSRLLVHRSVISSAIDALKLLIVSKRHVLKALETGGIKGEWLVFVNLLLERAATMAVYDINTADMNFCSKVCISLTAKHVLMSFTSL